MKLYTRPRVLPANTVRTGDHLAIGPNSLPIESEAAYIDHDLHGSLRWTVVDREPVHVAGRVKVYHSLGYFAAAPADTVVVRESMELDPWTYVERVDNVPAPR